MTVDLATLILLAAAVLLAARHELRTVQHLAAARVAYTEAAQDLAGSRMQVVHLEDARASLKRRVAELEERGVRERAEFNADRAQLLQAWAGERHELWERIQRPDQQPVPGHTDGVQRKLHWSEDDEIAGTPYAKVAHEAGLSPEHEKVVAHIDEIARTEGLGPAS